MKSKKNKLTNLLKTGILFFGISLLLWNCEKDNSNDFISENQSSISIEKIKTQFNASFNKNAFPRLNKEPLWEEAKTSYNQEGSQYIEIPFYKLHQEDIEMSSTLSFDKILVSKNIEDKLEIKIVHFFATDLKNKSIDFNQITHSELSGFNGFVTHFDLNKNPLEIKRYNNGRDTNQDFTYKDPKEIDNSLLRRDDDVANYFSETVCTRGCYYWEYSDGSRETISCSPWDCTSINMYVPNGRGGGSSGTSYNTERETEKIDDEKLTDPKIKCLNTKLNSSGNSFIKDILKNFKGESKVNINIESEYIVKNSEGEEVNATTSPIRNGVITIKISIDKSSASPALAVVRTLIHEYIHADMFRKVNEDSDLHKYPDFKETYIKYKDAKFEPTQHHSTMADLYVNSMRDALKRYHKNVLIGDYNYLTDNGTNPIDDNFYEALAWRGLKGQNVQAYIDLSDAKKLALKTSLEQNYNSTTKNCPNN